MHSGSGPAALDQALRDGDRLEAAPAQRASFRVRVLEQALSQVGAKPAARDTTIGGIRATPRHLREALEESYRRLAELTTDPDERARLVDKANSVRPWSLL